MFYIVGLGNPGEKYTHTRHNIGWLVLDVFREKTGLPNVVHSSAYVGRISTGVVEKSEVTTLYPETFMNNSGSAVAKLVSKSDAERLIVVHDDIDLLFGQIKVSVGRGDGGHNGLRSIIDALGSKEFVRVRVGIAKKHLLTGKAIRPVGEALNRFVLGDFSPKEQKKLEEIGSTVSEVITTIILAGPEVAMNRFNV